ncbi:MAG TPA: hypothetical protein VI792_04855, partial [Candidatus Eisenbacteria bacterium]
AALVAVAPDGRTGMQLGGADAKDETPTAHVSALVKKGAISAADGGPETIGGHEAWVGRVTTSGGGGGGGGRMVAAFVRWNPDFMIEALGQGGVSDENTILTSIRSLKDLTDPKRVGAQPDRIRVTHPSAEGVFSALVPTLGSQAISVEETAILNNMISTEPVPTGQPVKIVASGKTR